MDMANGQFNEKLIEEVKKYPSLYCQSKRSFADSNERSRIWQDIAAAIDPLYSGDYAKKRWLQMRDRYRKELKVYLRQGTNASSTRWKFFSKLSWLDPHLKDLYSKNDEYERGYRPMELFDPLLHLQSNMLLPPPEVLPDENKQNGLLPCVKGEMGGEESDTSSPSLTISDGLMDNRDSSSSRSNMAQMSLPILPQLFPSNEWNDEDFLFGRLVAVRMKKASNARRCQLRTKILSMLDSIETESDDDTVSVKSEPAGS